MSIGTQIHEVKLYRIHVTGTRGRLGAFLAAAHDRTQAKAIGEQWAADKGFSASVRVDVRRAHASETVYSF